MQPKIYQKGEHPISLDRVDTHAVYIIRKLKEAGHSAYLVGGGVRDLLLGVTPKDFDVSTSASPEEIRALFRNAILIGRRFRLAHIRFGNKVIEVSTFRAGATEEAGLIVRDNEWGNEEQDVLRRDFTINGLFYNPENETVIDYVDGCKDLEKRMLRTIGQPDVRFTQDPVRMIRLLKFCARFDFSIHHPTLQALLNCKEEIVKSSPARILEELLRMLESGASRPFFHLLNEYGLLKALTPALSSHLASKEGEATLHLLSCVDAEIKQEGKAPDRSLLLASLLFPLFHRRTHDRNRQQPKPLHLGQIAIEANSAIDEVFMPFFSLPRRMRWMVSTVLSTQCRLIPLDGKPVRRPRPSRDGLFPFALRLLKLRATADPELQSHYTMWTEAGIPAEDGEAPPPQRRRRRRRRRGPPPSP